MCKVAINGEHFEIKPCVERIGCTLGTRAFSPWAAEGYNWGYGKGSDAALEAVSAGNSDHTGRS